MLRFVFSPEWFYGKDIIIDIFSLLVLFVVGIFSLRYYKIKGKTNFLNFSIGLFLMGFSFILKSITNFSAYFDLDSLPILSLKTLEHLPFHVGYFFYRILMLAGLYVLYSIYTRQEKSSIVIMVYLLVALMVFSHYTYFIFHLTALMILIRITLFYILDHKKNLVTNKSLIISFSIITLSQFIFIFTQFHSLVYVLAEFVQLLGYIWLGLTFIMVLRHAKKEVKDRHN